MENLNMYQIPRSIMHDPLQNHVAHYFVTFSLDHFVTFSLDRLLLPIDMIQFLLHCRHCTLSYTLSCMLTPPLFAPLLSLHAQLPPLIGHTLLCMIAPTTGTV